MSDYTRPLPHSLYFLFFIFLFHIFLILEEFYPGLIHVATVSTKKRSSNTPTQDEEHFSFNVMIKRKQGGRIGGLLLVFPPPGISGWLFLLGIPSSNGHEAAGRETKRGAPTCHGPNRPSFLSVSPTFLACDRSGVEGAV